MSEWFKVQTWKVCVVQATESSNLSRSESPSPFITGFLTDCSECKKLEQSPSKLEQKGQTRTKLEHFGSFLSVKEVSLFLGVSRPTISRWCESGRLPAISISYGRTITYKISKQVVELFMQAEKQAKEAKEKEASSHHSEYIRGWLKAMEKGLISGKPYSPLTIDDYHSHVIKFFCCHEALNLKALEKDLLYFPAHQHGARIKRFKSLVCFGKHLIMQKVLTEDFLNKAKAIKPKSARPPKRITLTPEELERLLTACETIEDRMMIILLAQTGLRVSEACGLKLADINLDKAILTIKKGKGGKRRQLGLNEEVLQIFLLLFKGRKSKSQYLFLNEKGQQQTRHCIARRLKQIGKKAGIKVSPHALRRAFVTINANKGRPLQMLQIACGHSSIKTTMGYCMTSEQEVIDAMKGWE